MDPENYVVRVCFQLMWLMIELICRGFLITEFISGIRKSREFLESCWLSIFKQDSEPSNRFIINSDRQYMYYNMNIVIESELVVPLFS
jgi:hypothetical protein